MRRSQCFLEHTIPIHHTRMRVRLKIRKPAEMVVRYNDRNLPQVTVSFPKPDGEEWKRFRTAVDQHFVPYEVEDGRVIIRDKSFEMLICTTWLFRWMHKAGLARLEQKEFSRERGEFPLYINGRGWRIFYNIGSVILTELAKAFKRKKKQAETE